MRISIRAKAALVGVAASVAGLLTATSGTASAAAQPSISLRVVTDTNTDVTYAYLVVNDWTRGAAIWQAYGDSLYAEDDAADGYGINAHLSTGRVATTAGHASPYVSPAKTGNLAEGSAHTIWACLEKGGVEYACTTHVVVYA